MSYVLIIIRSSCHPYLKVHKKGFGLKAKRLQTFVHILFLLNELSLLLSNLLTTTNLFSYQSTPRLRCPHFHFFIVNQFVATSKTDKINNHQLHTISTSIATSFIFCDHFAFHTISEYTNIWNHNTDIRGHNLKN